MPNEIFNGDFSERYSERLEPTPKVNWRDRERQIGADISAGGRQTVAGLAWDFDKMFTDKIVSQMTAGDLVGAKASYDAANASISANMDQLISLGQIEGAGPLSDQTAARAKSLCNHEFLQRKVKLPDGSEVTIGKALSDDSQFNADRATNLRRLGFDETSIDTYIAGDRNIQSIMDPIVKEAAGAGGMDSVRNGRQLQDLARAYAADRDKISSVFGDGTTRFLASVRDTHSTSGNAAATMRSLVEFGKFYSERTGVSGHDLASAVASGYNNLLTYVTAGDQKQDRRGMPERQDISDAQRRQFDAVVIPALKATMARMPNGGSFDLDDPRLRRACKEIHDEVAYLSAAGADLMSSSRDGGLDINRRFGEYVANAMTNVTQPSSNIVAMSRGVRADLSNRIVGGHDAATIRAELSGRSQDYLSNLDKTNGTKSSCSEADGMAAEMHQLLVRSYLPMMVNGESYSSAADKYASGKMVDDLAARFANSFYGKGREEAGRFVAQAAASTFMGGGRVCIEDIIASAAFGGDTKLSEDATRTLRNWYHGNVAYALQFAREKEQLYNNYIADGYTDAQARRSVGIVSEMASDRMRDNSGNPQAVFDLAFNTGPYYVTEPDTGRIRRIHGDRRTSAGILDEKKAPVGRNLFVTDPTRWNDIQKMLAERKALQDRLDMEKRQEDARIRTENRAAERKTASDKERHARQLELQRYKALGIPPPSPAPSGQGS